MKHPTLRLTSRGSELPPYCFAGRKRPLVRPGVWRAVIAAVVAGAAVVAAAAILGRPEANRASAPPAPRATRPPRVVPRPAKRRHEAPSLAALVRAEKQQRVRLVALGTPFYCGRSGVREVAVTFDDGPGPRTRAILALLRRAKAPATFFEIGVNAQRRPRLARAEARAGEVGDHTLDHKNLDHLAPRAITHEILAGRAAIADAAGVTPVLFRPPYEGTSAVSHRLVRRAGLLEVLWSVDSRDWQNGNQALLRRRVRAELHPGGIVLLHEQAAHTLPTLRWLLAELKRRHLRPVTVSRLLADAAPATAQLTADRRGRACVEFPFRG